MKEKERGKCAFLKWLLYRKTDREVYLDKPKPGAKPRIEMICVLLTLLKDFIS